MERIVYVQEDRFDIPEELLKLTHEQIREKIKEERQKELEKKKKELEMRVESALKVSDIKTAKSLCEQLGEIVEKMVIA